MQEWLLNQWENSGKTVIFITHDVEEAVFLSKKILVIQDRPFSHPMECVEVPMDYPRKREELKRPEVVDLKEKCYNKAQKGAVNMRNKLNLPSLILTFILIIIWQCGNGNKCLTYILPTPVQVIEKTVGIKIYFLLFMPATMGVTFIGLAISIILGLGLAVIMG